MRARSSRRRSRREPPGWFAHREQFRFDPHELELHADARRFEAGTPGMASVYAQLGGLDVLDRLGSRTRGR